eukprot:3072802-Rhodomonas_salina.1
MAILSRFTLFTLLLHFFFLGHASAQPCPDGYAPGPCNASRSWNGLPAATGAPSQQMFGAMAAWDGVIYSFGGEW